MDFVKISNAQSVERIRVEQISLLVDPKGLVSETSAVNCGDAIESLL